MAGAPPVSSDWRRGVDEALTVRHGSRAAPGDVGSLDGYRSVRISIDGQSTTCFSPPLYCVHKPVTCEHTLGTVECECVFLPLHPCPCICMSSPHMRRCMVGGTTHYHLPCFIRRPAPLSACPGSIFSMETRTWTVFSDGVCAAPALASIYRTRSSVADNPVLAPSMHVLLHFKWTGSDRATKHSVRPPFPGFQPG